MESPAYSWIVDQAAKPQIRQSASFIALAKEKFQGLLPYQYHQKYLQEAYAVTGDFSGTFEEAIQLHALKAVPSEPVSFVSRRDNDRLIAQTRFLGLTEKSFARNSIFLGSSRHVLTNAFQLKGVGRTELSNRFNFHHSWGGFVYRDVLKSLLVDEVLSRRTAFGAMRIRACLIHVQEEVSDVPLALVLRESDSYRLSQISPYITAEERRILRAHLGARFPGQSAAEILACIWRNYYEAFLNGIHHKSFNEENLTLDGRFIDTESIDFTPDSRKATERIFLRLAPRAEDVAEGLSLSSLVRSGQDVFFVTSWIHNLRYALRLTERAFQSIFEGEVFSAEKVLRETDLGSRWTKLLSTSSTQEVAADLDPPESSFLLSRDVLENFSDYVCEGSSRYPDTSLELSFVPRGHDGADNEFIVSCLKKAEVFLYPRPGDLQASFRNWETLKCICEHI